MQKINLKSRTINIISLLMICFVSIDNNIVSKNQARAAIINCIHHPNTPNVCGGLFIQGPIVRGDYEKIEELLVPLRRQETGGADNRPPAHTISMVFISSPGGDLLEAMRIGRLLRRLHVETVAPTRLPDGRGSLNTSLSALPREACTGQECTCASACFFIWVSGVSRTGDNLFVHRPRATAAMASELGVADTRAALTQIRSLAIDYLREMEVPNAVIDLAMETEPSSLAWVGRRLVTDATGYDYHFVPSVVDALTERCSLLSLRQRQELARLEVQADTSRRSGRSVPNDVINRRNEMADRWGSSIICVWRELSVQAFMERTRFVSSVTDRRFEANEQARRAEARRRCQVRDRTREGQQMGDLDFDDFVHPQLGLVRVHRSVCVHALTAEETRELERMITEQLGATTSSQQPAVQSPAQGSPRPP